MTDLTLTEKNRILMPRAIVILTGRKAKLEAGIAEAAKKRNTNEGWDKGDTNPDIESQEGLVAVHQRNLIKVADILFHIKTSRQNGANYNVCSLCGIGRSSPSISYLFTPTMMLKVQEESGEPMDNFPCLECPKVKR